MKSDFKIYEEHGSIKVIYKGYKIDKYKLLSMAIKAENIKDSLKLLKVANIFKGDDVFDDLYFATINTITDRRMMEKLEPNELDYQKLFNCVYPYISNSKIISVKHDGKNIPDSWILKEKEKIPVEVKKDNFDNKALEQLKRYIRVYKCKHGIAVAKYLTIEIPDNIIFVSIKELEDFKNNLENN